MNKVELIYKDFIVAAREITRNNNRLISETRNLISHLERTTFDIINQCKDNLHNCTYNADSLENFLDKYNKATSEPET